MAGRKFENDFYSIQVFGGIGFDTGKTVDKKPLIFPPGKKFSVTDIEELVLKAQAKGAKIKNIGSQTVKELSAYAKDGHIVLTELEGLLE